MGGLPSRNETTAGSSGATKPCGNLAETPIRGGDARPVGLLLATFRFLDCKYEGTWKRLVGALPFVSVRVWCIANATLYTQI